MWDAPHWGRKMWDAPHCLYRHSLVTFHTVKTSLNIFTLIKSIIQQIKIMYRRKDFDKAVHTYIYPFQGNVKFLYSLKMRENSMSFPAFPESIEIEIVLKWVNDLWFWLEAKSKEVRLLETKTVKWFFSLWFKIIGRPVKPFRDRESIFQDFQQLHVPVLSNRV